MAEHSGTRRYILAGGGSGGHLCPGLAIAEQLVEVDPGCEVLFLATERPIDASLLKPTGWPYRTQPVVPLPKRLGQLGPFIRAWRASTALCRKLLTDGKDTVVLGLGGFASGPAVKVAARLLVPTALLNPDSVPGVANRFASRYVSAIYLQWESSRAHFKKASQKCRLTGCPIRRDFVEQAVQAPNREAILTTRGLRSDRKTLLIVGGSQGGHNVNAAVMKWLFGGRAYPFEDVLRGWQLIHLTGRDDYEAIDTAYRARTIPAHVEAFSQEMAALLSVSELVLGRAGASTLAELTATGTPAILMPYPYHRDQHQRRNAEALASAGAARIVEDRCDPQINAEALDATIRSLLAEQGWLETMAAASKSLGKPEAANTIALSLKQL